MVDQIYGTLVTQFSILSELQDSVCVDVVFTVGWGIVVVVIRTVVAHNGSCL